MYVSDTDPNAPWNQTETLTASGTIKVDISLTNMATVETDEAEEDEDEDGICVVPKMDADWQRAYIESKFSIVNLLGKLAEIAKNQYEITKSKYDKCIDFKERHKLYNEYMYWYQVLEHSKGWKVEYLECERA